MLNPIATRLLDLYRIGPGPSSSHTVGPMRAAAGFRAGLLEREVVPARIGVALKGSLSATGRGHGCDRAILAGLQGWAPDACDVDALRALPETLATRTPVAWGPGAVPLAAEDVAFLPFSAYRDEILPHPNTMVFTAYDADGVELTSQTWVSVGGGFVHEIDGPGGDVRPEQLDAPPHPYHDGASLLVAARNARRSIGELVLANEAAWESTPGEVRAGLDRVWAAMCACVERGLTQHGELPGGLGMKRRARELMRDVHAGAVDPSYAPIARAQAYAFAINEENAAGGRVVTAPTNGAAGILPAVLKEATDRMHLGRDAIHRALATAGAFGGLIKAHASLSGAEVGCQGEVGSATAMAAAALCEIQGGTPEQVENAAEIAMEHNLGLTCDPLKGLVQAPCIERNAMGVAKAASAAQLARHAIGQNLISFDRVVQVMKRTGDDMRREYKETGEGGLAVAVNVPEC